MFIPGKFRSGPSGGCAIGPSLVIYVREEQLNTTVYTVRICAPPFITRSRLQVQPYNTRNDGNQASGQ